MCRTATFILSIVILSAFTCCDRPVGYVEVLEGKLPRFKLETVDGSVITDERFRAGHALFFIPLDGAETNSEITACVEVFEENEGLEINKLCLLREGEDGPAGWFAVRNSNLRSLFTTSGQDNFMVLFENGKLKKIFTVDKTSGASFDIRLFRFGLYKNILNLETPREVIESHRPEDLIDTDLLFRVADVVLGGAERRYILYVNEPTVKCSDVIIVKLFENLLAAQENASGALYFDPGFSVVDISSFLANFRIGLPVIPSDGAIDRGILDLHELNFSGKYNILFVFKGDEFVGSVYLFNDCEPLYMNI